MIWVIHCNAQSITKNGGCFAESNMMLPKVLFSFVSILFELYHRPHRFLDIVNTYNLLNFNNACQNILGELTTCMTYIKSCVRIRGRT